MKLMSKDEALSLRLEDREGLLHERGLASVEPNYCIVWEDPTEIDAPAKVTVPSPEWLALAIHGNVLPPVEVWPIPITNGKAIIPDKYHDEVVGPLSEEEAMEYLLQKDIPDRVWADDTANAPRYRICKRSMIPTDRMFRNAWRLVA
jgi:hypothetical protein